MLLSLNPFEVREVSKHGLKPLTIRHVDSTPKVFQLTPKVFQQTPKVFQQTPKVFQLEAIKNT